MSDCHFGNEFLINRFKVFAVSTPRCVKFNHQERNAQNCRPITLGKDQHVILLREGGGHE